MSNHHSMRRLFLALVVAALAAAGVAISPAQAAQTGNTEAAFADPPWSVDPAQLEAALECPHPFSHPDKEPVLLVHGTFTTAHENFGWSWELLLPEQGFDYCVVNYGLYTNRATEDMQVSAEYVAYAVNAMYERTGRKVDIIGHSQGGMMPRWAVKWWPSVQAHVDDYVSLAGPHHGVALANDVEGSPFGAPAVAWQFDPSSNFVAALNAGDESPGDLDYTSIYATTDELVQPAAPVPTAVLDWQREGPNVRNVNVQDLCPGRLVGHVTIGTTDRVAMALTLDALVHPGPVDPDRLDLTPLCILPDQYMVPAQMQATVELFRNSFSGDDPQFGQWESVDAEPDIKPYALAAGSDAAPAPAPAAGDDASRRAPDQGASVGDEALPATGGEDLLVVGGAVLGLAFAIRRRLATATLPRPRSRG